MDHPSSSKYYTVTVRGLTNPIRLSELGGAALADGLASDELGQFIKLTDLYSEQEQLIKVSLIERIEPRYRRTTSRLLIGQGKEELSRSQLNRLEYGEA